MSTVQFWAVSIKWWWYSCFSQFLSVD